MMNKNIAIAFAVVLAIICLAEATEEGPQNMADALRMLQELDRIYTQAARPRIDRRDVADEDRVDPDLLNRAVRLLVLQKLDNIYSYHTRPRFGKRSDAYTNWAKDLEYSDLAYHFGTKSEACSPEQRFVKPDIPAWLSYARRR